MHVCSCRHGCKAWVRQKSLQQEHERKRRVLQNAAAQKLDRKVFCHLPGCMALLRWTGVTPGKLSQGQGHHFRAMHDAPRRTPVSSPTG